MLRLPHAAAVGLIAMLATGNAWSFCLGRSCDPDYTPGGCELDPDTSCSVEGVEIRRESGCVSFGVEAGAAEGLGITDDEFSALVEQALERWASVDCGSGQSPSIAAESVGSVDVHEPFACPYRGANLDVWMLTALTPETNVQTLGNSLTVGLTTTEFETTTGTQVDSDVELDATWLKALADSLPKEELLDILLTISTHEAGHALGLAHSSDRKAFMFSSYDVRADRELTQDDIDGICTLYPPDSSLECGAAGYIEAAISEEACSELGTTPNPGGGCAVALPSSGSPQLPYLLTGLLLAALIRRRSQSNGVRGTQLSSPRLP